MRTNSADDLLKRMRSARERWVDIDGYRFLIRRPTVYQIARWRASGDDELVLLAQAIVGWDNVRERDLIPSGADELVPYDHDVLAEWISDKPELMSELMQSIASIISERERAIEEVEKK